jgi:hypothetical protein
VISLRQHVASLVAVFLALAVGIALGGGLLTGSGEADDDQPASTTTDSTSQEAAPADDATEYADAFAAEGAQRLYANGLAGHAAVILAMPGAESTQVRAMQDQIVAAGGAVTGTFTAGEALVDPGQKSLVDTLGSQLMTQVADPRVDTTAATYDRMGQLLALAIATDQSSSVDADPAALTIREGLAGADLLNAPADVRNAPLVLVVLPSGRKSDPESLAVRTILSGLVNGMASNAVGVVVAGDEDSADAGDLAALRASELFGAVSTVDGIQSTIGQVTTVLAMMSVLGGTGGAYGASGSDGPVPLS